MVVLNSNRYYIYYMEILAALYLLICSSATAQLRYFPNLFYNKAVMPMCFSIPSWFLRLVLCLGHRIHLVFRMDISTTFHCILWIYIPPQQLIITRPSFSGQHLVNTSQPAPFIWPRGLSALHRIEWAFWLLIFKLSHYIFEFTIFW